RWRSSCAAISKRRAPARLVAPLTTKSPPATERLGPSTPRSSRPENNRDTCLQHGRFLSTDILVCVKAPCSLRDSLENGRVASSLGSRGLPPRLRAIYHRCLRPHRLHS